MKKHWFFVCAALVLTLLTLALPDTGWAAGRVGIIDLALIMDESKAGKQANAVLADLVEQKRQELVPMEEQLEQLASLLDSDDVPDDERAMKQAEWDELVQRYNNAVLQFEAEIDEALQTLRNQILADIGTVLQMVGDSRGFDMIVDASSAYYYRRTVDLTFDVLREYDDLWDAATRSTANSQP